MDNLSSDSLLGEIFDYLEHQTEQVYLVGGSLRQILLKKSVKDYDFIVARGAIGMAKQLARQFCVPFFPLDRDRDMARIVLPEVVLDFASYQGNLLQDLGLRDLTINAIACPVSSFLLTGQTGPDLFEQLIDPCQGLADLEARVIRGISRENFADDPLRLLRIYRFAAILDFVVDPETEIWAAELAADLNRVAHERILQEFQQILLSQRACKWLKRLHQQGLLSFLPHIDSWQALGKFEEMSSGSFPVQSGYMLSRIQAYLSHEIAAQRPRLFVWKLALLLLSPGHFSCQGLDLLRELTLSRKELELLEVWGTAVKPLCQLLMAAVQDEPAVCLQRFELFRGLKEDILGLVLLGWVWCAGQQLQDPHARLALLCQEWIDDSSPVAHPALLVDGHDLMRTLALPAGPQIGQLLLEIQRAQAKGVVFSRQQALAFAKTWCTENIGPI